MPFSAFEAAAAFLRTLGADQVAGAAERRVELARKNLEDARARFEAQITSSNDVPSCASSRPCRRIRRSRAAFTRAAQMRKTAKQAMMRSAGPVPTFDSMKSMLSRQFVR